jgi:hypothetical protein
MSAQSDNEKPIGAFIREIPVFKPMNAEGQFWKNDSGGDITIDAISIQEVKIYESIDQPVLFGHVTFIDKGIERIASLFRDGFDFLEMTIRSNNPFYTGIEKKFKLEILNITGREFGRLYRGTDQITIEFTLYPAYRNLYVWNISKGWSDTKISDIVTDLFKTYLNTKGDYKITNNSSYNKSNSKDGSIQNTNGVLPSFCIPYWNLHTTLEYLKKFSIAEGTDEAGYFYWFDSNGFFNYKSLRKIASDGMLWSTKLTDIRSTSPEELLKGEITAVNDYYVNMINKQYYKCGLSGSQVERFNWYKKKGYIHKVGYSKRPMKRGPNEVFERPENINNIYGIYNRSGMRWSGDDTLLSKAINFNKILESISTQVQTEVVINGIPLLKCGDYVVFENNVKSLNENIIELAKNTWFIRSVSSWWYPDTPFRQKLHLCAAGDKLYHPTILSV